MPRQSFSSSKRSRRPASFTMASPRLDLGPAGLHTVSDSQPLRIRENWQQMAYMLSSQVGEVGYLLNLKSNTVAKCNMQPQRRVPGTDDWVDTDDPRAMRVMKAFVGPTGGTPELMRRATLHYEIAGEAFLIGSPIVDERERSAGLLWEMLSPLEIRVEKGKAKRIAGGVGGGNGDDVPLDGYYARMIRSDPAFSARADSVIRRVLPIMEEVVLLTQVVDAIAKSRLVSGLLFMPEEVSFGNDDESDEDWDDSQSGDPFEGELETYFTRAIEDRSSPNSLIPGLLRAPAMIDGHATKDLIGIIDLSRGIDKVYKELRTESIIRLVAGLDAPPEMVTGKGGLNHWTGYNIDNEFLNRHVLPAGEFITEFFTASYFRPMLKVFEQMERGETEDFKLRFDSSPVSARIDASTTTREAYDRNVASDLSYAKAIGLEPNDMPSEDELKRRLLTTMASSQPIALGGVLLPILYPDDPQIAKAVEGWPGADGSTPPEPIKNDPVPQGTVDPHAVTVPAPSLAAVEDDIVWRLAGRPDGALH